MSAVPTMRKSLALLVLMMCGAGSFAQPPAWTARWIDVPGTSGQDYGVYHFRRTFELPARPARLVVDVSGDNRYELYVNGVRVSWGPARGDLQHWRYETVDIAPQLRDGRNVLAAVVWNDGPNKAIAQISLQTGFVLHSDNPVVNSNRSWRCMVDKAYTSQPLPRDQNTGYWAVAGNERLDAAQYPWGWNQVEYDDSAWLEAHEIGAASLRSSTEESPRRLLEPSPIRLEEQKLERFAKIRQSTPANVSDTFLKGQGPLTIPAHTTVSLLLDQGYETTAFPELTVSEGKGAKVDLHYAEALFLPAVQGQGREKGNRDEVEGKRFLGPFDTYVADGGAHRLYRPLYWRTFRYVKLDVTTAEQPLSIEDLHEVFTSYPFERKAVFQVENGAGPDQEVQRILTTGWRTARLCAHETYMDCPFYEQLQYGGDARIQMLVSLYTAGDASLMRSGISMMDSTRNADGLMYSRAPSSLAQYIPGFSLWWIGMVHDYLMYTDDARFVRQMLPGVRSVLSYFAGYQKESGSLARMPFWTYADWVKAWPRGAAPDDETGSSAVFDLQLALAYDWAADLEKTVGNGGMSESYRAEASKLKAWVMRNDWDAGRGLFADQPSHRTWSQHANTLAMLAHLVPPAQGRAIYEKMIADPSLAPTSIYYRAYTNAALREVGLGDRYLEMLEPWRQILNNGLTTWAETADPARSDCHAWGASPNFELLRTVAGIDSMAPGFARVRVAPNMGQLTQVHARMPHPKGEIDVQLVKRVGKLTADIELPAGITGEFEWAGTKKPLAQGKNHLTF
jgi:alpha-L-rhamnosidase